MYAFTEHFVLPLSHDEVVHGKGSLLRKIPGDRWQQLATLRAYFALHVGAPGQAAAVHGRRARPRRPSGPRAAAWTGGCSTTPTTAACSRLVTRPQPGLPARRPRCGSATTTPAGSSGSTPTTRSTTCSRSCAGDPTGRCVACVANFAAVPHDGYRLGAAVRRPLGRGRQHRLEPVLGQRRRQPRAGSGRTRGRTAAGRRPPAWSCRRWRRSGSASPAAE